jgi:hypothetical protein
MFECNLSEFVVFNGIPFKPTNIIQKLILQKIFINEVGLFVEEKASLCYALRAERCGLGARSPHKRPFFAKRTKARSAGQ